MHKKILIIQFRAGKVEHDEQKAFITKLGIDAAEVIFLNVLEKHTLPDIEDLYGIILAGSGDNSLTKEHRWYQSVEQFVKKAIQKKIPILGVCFGHQLLGRVYGAKVVEDPAQKELGSIAVELSPVGKKEVLFKNIDSLFYTIAGHNDCVVQLPDSLIILAFNQTCQIQAFKVKDAAVFGVQFHPELTEKDYRTRLEYYKDYYVQTGSDFQELLDRGSKKTTDDALLKNFLEICRPES